MSLDAWAKLVEQGMRTGWNVESRLEVACRYIDNQASADDFAAFVEQFADDELDDPGGEQRFLGASDVPPYPVSADALRTMAGALEARGLGDDADALAAIANRVFGRTGPEPIECIACGKETVPVEGEPRVCPCGALLTTDGAP